MLLESHSMCKSFCYNAVALTIIDALAKERRDLAFLVHAQRHPWKPTCLRSEL
jgi:hypothetical protein